MSITKKVISDKTIYVLGAGASRGAQRYPKHRGRFEGRMPLSKSFFRDIGYQKRPDGTIRILNVFPMMMEGPGSIIEKCWGIHNHYWASWKGFGDLNIEDVFTFFDISAEMLQVEPSSLSRIQGTRDDMLKWICVLINSICLGQRCLLLQELFSTLGPRDSVFSFNWDTIADLTLDYLDNKQFQNYVRLMDIRRKDMWFSRDGGYYLKLHGSINWGLCKNAECPRNEKPQLCFSKSGSVGNRLKGWWYKHPEKCPSCAKEIFPYIIPPSSRKIIQRDSFMGNIWRLASTELDDASKIVFIGYSFPTGDYYSDWLFRTLNIVKAPALKRIVIVNPNATSKRDALYRRYKSIFSQFEIGEVYPSLKDFVSARRSTSPK